MNKCYFKFKDETRGVEVESFFNVREGFWLDERFQLCDYANSGGEKYWIPPHMILFIEKS